ERAGARPLGFVASDYALAIWMLGDVGDKLSSGRLSLSTLFDQDMLGDDLDAWLDESSVMRRTFHHCAMISGLVERRHVGEEKTGRQMSISTGLIYDVLRSHQPDHILLKAARADAATGLLDIHRLGDMLARVRERFVLKILPQVSPLAVPILLDIGRESVAGVSAADVLGQAAARLVEDATR
ncbi:MAG: DNA ligase-associated DEXH box helicase, partial [Hyphomicrobiales bacterium]|nr:DNA ligase-associated DEXH box helicase [Hyphomicrobiales bacterium]